MTNFPMKKLIGEAGVTNRGFDKVVFEDVYESKCSLQESSLAVCEDDDGNVSDPLGWLWLGIEDANPQVMKSQAFDVGLRIPDGPLTGFMPYPIPKQVHLTTRMHLGEEQVRALIARLELWLETGRIVSEEEQNASRD